MTSPWTGLVPKSDTQADLFVSNRPECDGRGVVVAILDTGVDPGAIGMQRTPDGRPKVVDLVDATGAGDVDTSAKAKTISPACVKGLSGRELHLGAWDNPSGVYKLGLAKGYDLFPKSLVRRLKKERKARWDRKQRAAIGDLEVELSSLQKMSQVDQKKDDGKSSIKDRIADTELKLSQLREACAATSPDDGPVYDLVVFQDGNNTWRTAIDLGQNGDLRGATLFTNFRAERQYGTFEEHDGLMNFAVNIYNNGDLVSIYCDTGAHGTHVAGIVAGHNPESPELDGVAPGAQIVGIKIGDTRLGSMETGPGLERGLLAVLENGCDVINMSYGEPTKTPNKGRFAEFARLVVEEHGVVFVASAGNAGPALSTAGAPGGTTSSLIAVGAFVSRHMMRDEYAMRDGSGNFESSSLDVGQKGSASTTTSNRNEGPKSHSGENSRDTLSGLPKGVQYTWSSRGPAFDGDYGPNVSAPGGAITCVPNWTLQRNMLMNGTSMSSPNCAGNVALLISALKRPEYSFAGVTITPHLIKRALENTAKKVAGHTFHDIGHGVIQTEAAFQWILRQNLVAHSPQLRGFTCHCNFNGKRRRGLYLRDACDISRGPVVVRVSVNPEFRDALTSHNNRDRVDFQLRAVLSSTARWVQAPDRTLIMHGGRGFDIRVDPSGLAPGLHTAEVWGRDQNTPDSSGGPLFRFPVTVVVPHPPSKPRPAFSTPAVDISTVALGEHVWTMTLCPGQITRQFLTVPHGASWIDVAVKGGDTYGGGDNGANPRLYALHLQQVSDDDAHRDISFKKFFYLASPEAEPGDGRRVFSYALSGAASGQSIEVCFAQYWSSLGDSSVELRAAFRTGVLPSERSVSIMPGEGWSKVSLYNPGPRAVTVKPEGKLTKWTRVLLPGSAGTVSAPSVPSRDMWPDGRLTHTITIVYGPFDQDSAGKVTPSCPLLSNLLYDSPVGAQMFTFKDSHGRVVGTVDAFPEEASLGAGKGFTCALTIAHHDISVLKKFEKAPLWITRSCKADVSVSVHSSRSSVAVGGGAFKARVLRPGQRCNVFFALDTQSKLAGVGGSGGDIRDGDFFTGTVSYIDEKSDSQVTNWGAGKYPGGFPLKAVYGGVKGGKKSSSKNTGAFGIPGSLKSRGALSLQWAIDRLVRDFEGKGSKEYASEAAVVREALEAEEDKDEGTSSFIGTVTREEGQCLAIMLLHSELRHADASARKLCYLESVEAGIDIAEQKTDAATAESPVSETGVVLDVGNEQGAEAKHNEDNTIAAADKLIAAIDANSIAAHFGTKIPEGDEEGKRLRKEMRARRSILCDALHRKLHALITSGDVKAVEECWSSLQKWCSTSDPEYALASLRRALLKGESGMALKLLLGMVGPNYNASKHLASEKRLRQELLRMYKANGWEHLAENEKMGVVVKFP